MHVLGGVNVGLDKSNENYFVVRNTEKIYILTGRPYIVKYLFPLLLHVYGEVLITKVAHFLHQVNETNGIVQLSSLHESQPFVAKYLEVVREEHTVVVE